MEREPNLDQPKIEDNLQFEIKGLPTSDTLQAEYKEDLAKVAPNLKSDASTSTDENQSSKTPEEMTKDEICDRIIEFHKIAGTLKNCRPREVLFRMTKNQLIAKLNEVATKSVSDAQSASPEEVLNAAAQSMESEKVPQDLQNAPVSVEAIMMYETNKTLMLGFSSIFNELNPYFEIRNPDIELAKHKEALLQSYAQLFLLHRSKLQQVFNPANRIIFLNLLVAMSCSKSKKIEHHKKDSDDEK